jgi:hypothetical protein
MKTGTAVPAVACLLFISVVSLETFWGASAQSGRVIPKPTQPPSAESPKQPEAGPKFVADPDADKFKLVFPISYGKRLYKDPPKNRKEKKEREKEIERDDENKIVSYRNSFIDELNKAGERGYRLTALGSPLIAIVRLGAVQYEYAWFETTSDILFYKIYKIGLKEKYAQLAGQGYSVVDRNELASVCTSPPADALVPLDSCIYRDLFILEREKGVETPSQFKHVWHEPGWRQLSPDAPLTKQINESMASGFNPILALSKCEVLLQRNTDKGEFLPEGIEVKVVTGRNVKKKVNKLAGQGYRLALIHNQVAVMRRSRDTTAPVSYIWLDSWKKKNFEPELARLQDSGAIYRMTYPDSAGGEYELIFEQPSAGAGKRREYKVLKIEFQETENFADQRMDIDLRPSSKETLKTLNSLVKEGFVVRDLFVSEFRALERPRILLERTQ